MLQAVRKYYWSVYYYIFGGVTEEYVQKQFKKMESDFKGDLSPQFDLKICDCVIYDKAGKRLCCRPGYSKAICDNWTDTSTDAVSHDIGFCDAKKIKTCS